MENKSVVAGEYITFKHVKTRKVVILEVEVPEEHFQHVINTLGMPIGGESKPVAVALLDKQCAKNAQTEQTEGEKLRTRAILLCQQDDFQSFLDTMSDYGLFPGCVGDSETAAKIVRHYCDIQSRSELAMNIKAQIKFKELLSKFDSWKLSNQYADNLSKV